MNPKVIVNIPATSANMGPGLDCLGIALDVWNTVKVFDGNSSVDVNGYGEEVLPRDETNLVYKGFAEFFRVIDEAVPSVKLVCENNIKLARGMGSSSAALVGGLSAANSYDSKDHTFVPDVLTLGIRPFSGHIPTNDASNYSSVPFANKTAGSL